MAEMLISPRRASCLHVSSVSLLPATPVPLGDRSELPGCTGEPSTWKIRRLQLPLQGATADEATELWSLFCGCAPENQSREVRSAPTGTWVF